MQFIFWPFQTAIVIRYREGLKNPRCFCSMKYILTLQGYPGVTGSNSSCLQNRRDYTGDFSDYTLISYTLHRHWNKHMVLNKLKRGDSFLFRRWNRDTSLEAECQSSQSCSRWWPVFWGACCAWGKYIPEFWGTLSYRTLEFWTVGYCTLYSVVLNSSGFSCQ